ncbi:MAG TPA: hypothetical protein PKM36_08375 [Propionibacteriaceae bacterium]|nr:hypothetical protein [Propionibacteriaceae bacterium]HPZ50552.1 hypothetical protein [Propionibacteriaceae bacterium]HQE31486.1 hypothetical protein [Propionibacteriaceae bacterium]
MPSYWKDPDRTPITSDEAIRLWAGEAYDLLVRVASRYNKVVGPAELVSRAQELTGVRTDVPTVEWYPRLLQTVIHRCHATGEPPLTSLVVNPRDESVGVAYAEVLKLQGLAGANALAREKHAAAARLDCYLKYASNVPPNATPQLTSTARRAATAPARARAASGPRTPRAVKPEPVPDKPLNRVCPTCFLETPLNGECQNCM